MEFIEKICYGYYRNVNVTSSFDAYDRFGAISMRKQLNW